jgi:uncharacterized protein YodC (DUF2158 family)
MGSTPGQRFKIGEVVTLKSGGPDMTIQELYDSGQQPGGVRKYRCHWFAGQKLEGGVFSEDSLETPKPPTYG